MQTNRPSLFARDDTFFGVCEGLGEDFGINANLLRLAFTLALFLNPPVALAVYAAAGAVVLVSRMLFPVPRNSAPQAAPADAVETEAGTVEAEPVALAA